MQLKNTRGFTLVEVIVVAGIIAVLAGILVPLIFKEIDESKTARAAADVRAISSAMIVLKKDTGQWPVSSTCEPTVTLLNGSGTMPTFSGAGWNAGEARGFDQKLINDKDNANCWPNTFKGPYIASVNADPWGNAYVTNGDAFVSASTPKPPAWILSAGPDGIVQTAATDGTVQGDDVGLRVQ